MNILIYFQQTQEREERGGGSEILLMDIDRFDARFDACTYKKKLLLHNLSTRFTKFIYGPDQEI